jgi:hypothetical protein
MNALHGYSTAASSITSRGRLPAITRHETPNGSVMAGPVV